MCSRRSLTKEILGLGYLQCCNVKRLELIAKEIQLTAVSSISADVFWLDETNIRMELELELELLAL